MAKQTSSLPRNILVLGATSAMAQATARILATQGCALYLVARDRFKLATVQNDLLTRGASAVTAMTLDLDDLAAHGSLIADAAATLGTIDMALLAHGVLGDQAEAQADARVAEAVYQTNFLSPASLITYLANYFEGRGSGCLAVISSVAGDRGRKSNYVYGASKAALNVLLDGVRNRIDRAGVQVLTIKPGFVATPMTAHLPKNGLFASPEQIARGILSAVEKRRDVVYLPGFWRLILWIIRMIPERVFKNLNL